MNSLEKINPELAYKVICAEIRKRIKLNNIDPEWKGREQTKICNLWKELMPNIFEKAETSVYQSLGYYG